MQLLPSCRAAARAVLERQLVLVGRLIDELDASRLEKVWNVPGPQ
jgi:hypothetical protein